ncbi:MAG: zinc ribbon domain-containing protein [Gammaproteobacteria bacterium]|nr:zinc ribbon domain-containing protein [Gammaproteobacteria bacterium]
MPLYDYECPKCSNEFSELQTLEEYSPLRVCPKCNAPSARKISAAHLEILKKNERIIKERNERAVFEPRKVKKQHSCSDHNHDHEEKSKGVLQQISAGSRPWMLG